jgi:copper chaperone CopZ
MNKLEKSVSISGMTCSGCSSRLQKLFERHSDVEKATVSHETGTAQIIGSINSSEIEQIVENAGFTFNNIN